MTNSRLAAVLILCFGSPAFGQMAEIPPVKAPVGGSGLSGVASVGAALTGGPTLGNAATVSLANTLPQPLITSRVVGSGPMRAASIASSDARTPDAKPLASAAGAPTAAASPVDVHQRRFGVFVKNIMGGRLANEKEMRALLDAYLEERGVLKDSQVAEALETRLFAPPEPVSPRFAAYARGLREVAKAHGVPVARLERMIVEQGLDQVIAGPHESDILMRALDQSLTSQEIRAAVAHYPSTEQGEAMRDLASSVASRSGNSVEELARAGAFLYVDFHGRRVHRTSSGRDPDVSTCDVVFYGVIHNGKWKIEVYRQNKRGDQRDDFYNTALKDWLLAGGLNNSDFQ